MILANMVIAVIIGAILGFLFARLIRKEDKKQNELRADLEKSRFELEQYRQDMIDHFAKSASLLEHLSKDYAKLYHHMASSSNELTPSQHHRKNPFNSLPLDNEFRSETLPSSTPSSPKKHPQTQPKDYSEKNQDPKENLHSHS